MLSVFFYFFSEQPCIFHFFVVYIVVSLFKFSCSSPATPLVMPRSKYRFCVCRLLRAARSVSGGLLFLVFGTPIMMFSLGSLYLSLLLFVVANMNPVFFPFTLYSHIFTRFVVLLGDAGVPFVVAPFVVPPWSSSWSWAW